MSTRGIDDFQYTKKLLMDIEKTRYRYLAFSLFISFFGDIFLRLHLRDLCYTKPQRKAKKSGFFSYKQKKAELVTRLD